MSFIEIVFAVVFFRSSLAECAICDINSYLFRFFSVISAFRCVAISFSSQWHIYLFSRGINEIVFVGVFERYFDCVYGFFGSFCFLSVFYLSFLIFSRVLVY